jgi:hypothetical protein
MPGYDDGPLFDRGAETEVELLVRQDVERGLEEWFEPEDTQFQVRTDLLDAGPIANGEMTAVAWRFTATPRRSVWGVAADRGAVEVHGTTFCRSRDGADAEFSRYIDWHQLFVDLGVAAAGRITREPTGAAS